MEMVYNYTVNPVWTILKKIGSGIVYAAEVQGYAKAAAELSRQGYHEEAKEIILELANKKRESE